MKKLTVIIVALAIMAGITGCKKGENDPAISLRSRKARITGVWNLVSANYVEKRSNSTTTYDFSDDTNVMTETYSNGAISITNNYTYSKQLTINKDYTFTIVEKITDNGITTITTEGTWYFAPANDELELKNKEAVVFQITKIETVDDDGDRSFEEYIGTTNSHVEIFQLDELTNKEITVLMDYTQLDEDGFRYSISGNEVFVQD